MSFRQQQIAVFLATLILVFGIFATGVAWFSKRLTEEATLQTSIVLARQVEIALADSLRQAQSAAAPGTSPWEFLGRLFPAGRQSKPVRSKDAEVSGLIKAYLNRNPGIEAMWVLNSEGKVLYASDEHRRGELSDNSKLSETLSQGVPTIEAREEGGVTYYDVMVPLQMPQGAVGPGGLRLWINPSAFRDLVSGLSQEITLLFVLAGGVAFGSALLTTFMYSRRFRLIAETLRQAESGTYQTRPRYPSRDQVSTSLDLIDRLVMKHKSAGELAAPLRRVAVASRTLAHEVRNPLNALAVHLELLRSSSADGVATGEAVQEKSLGAMEAAIRQVDEIVRDFADYTVPVALDRKPIDLAQVLQSSLDAIKAQCSLQGIKIATDLPGGPWPVNGDDSRLRQAFDNLLRNAIEAQPQGGMIRISGQRNNGQVILRFVDGGSGVPPEKRATLFDFGQSTKPGGSGIGLPLSQLIIEAHGGRLDYEDDSGTTTGATFRLTLNLSQSTS